MGFKKSLFIVGLFLLILAGTSFVSASENMTEISDDALSIDDSQTLEKTSSVKTTTIVDSVTVNEGDSFTFTANVKASNGMTAPGSVIFKYGKNEFEKNLDTKGSTYGTFKGTLKPGDYVWTATYTGSTTTSGANTYNFLKSQTNFTLTVKGSAKVIANDFNSFYKSCEKYQIVVVNNLNDNPIANKKLEITSYINTTHFITSYHYTDENGIFEGTVNRAPGRYEIVARLVDDYYDSNSASFKVHIEKASANLISSKITSNVDSYTMLKVIVKDAFGNNVDEGQVIFTINGNKYVANVKNGVATKQIKLLKGTYYGSAEYSGENYIPFKTTVSAVVGNAPAKISLNKWISTTKSYATLKATVKNSLNKKVNEGFIIFKVNGKTYKVKTKNGMAIKKIKLKKAKTYKYTATFTSENYNAKKATSKVIVKKAKKWYILRYGKYSAKLSYKQYLSLLNAQNNGKFKEITLKTGKYNTYKFQKYKNKKVTVYKWKYKNVLYREIYWNDDFSGYNVDDDYTLDAYYWNHGWKSYGVYSKTYDDGHYEKHFTKYKKKLKTTITKKVKNGYKKVKYPIEIIITSFEEHNGFSIDFYDDYKGHLGGKSKKII